MSLDDIKKGLGENNFDIDGLQKVADEWADEEDPKTQALKFDLSNALKSLDRWRGTRSRAENGENELTSDDLELIEVEIERDINEMKEIKGKLGL